MQLKQRRAVWFFLIILVSCSGDLWARPVEPPEAEQAARQWLLSDNPRKTARLTQTDFSFRELTPWLHEGSVVGYVASLSPSGFMVMPAVTELAPIQFIAYEAGFEVVGGHPFLATIRERLRETLRRLGYLPPVGQLSEMLPGELDSGQKSKNETAWENLLADQRLAGSVSSSETTPLLTSRWNQSYPYSLQTPNQFPTGCSATALAQVMYYWKHPTSGQGSHSYPWFDGANTVTLNADFNHPYEWANMLADYTGGETEAQRQAVAQLLADVGKSIETDYSPTSSAAQLYTNNALVTFFKYAPTVKTIHKFEFATEGDWFENFKIQLDSRLPVLLAIYPLTHSVVVDGYRTDNFLNLVHVNLGWGGLSDGYYALNSIYHGSGSSSDYALVNIYPEGYTPSGPSVSGTILGHDQLPVQCAEVQFWREITPGSFNMVLGVQTDAAGRYSALLSPGNYKIYLYAEIANWNFSECDNGGRKFNSEWYNNLGSFNPDMFLEDAAIIAIKASSGPRVLDGVLGPSCPTSVYQNPSWFAYIPYENQTYSLQWGITSYATRYQVQRATFPDFRDAARIFRQAAPHYYMESGLPPGTYYYRVRAEIEGCGASLWTAGPPLVIENRLQYLFLPLIRRDDPLSNKNALKGKDLRD
jgi:hypothetical protein